ncbi:hypothetical protein AAFF_G00269090 [Aldrovandia affinis]|uniref:Uncharacterized protein n=1 Tax=Aldrovandia affinis TaxID=143900 RepID=A0AAD7WSY9_9TELE|nr:hypothetical protein AAFF_G00269090 [Aldrovandia affinis]
MAALNSTPVRPDGSSPRPWPDAVLRSKVNQRETWLGPWFLLEEHVQIPTQTDLENVELPVRTCPLLLAFSDCFRNQIHTDARGGHPQVGGRGEKLRRVIYDRRRA